MSEFTVALMTKQHVATPLGGKPAFLTSQRHGVNAESHLEALTKAGLSADDGVEAWDDDGNGGVLAAIEEVSVYIVEQLGGDSQFFDSQANRIQLRDFVGLCSKCLVATRLQTRQSGPRPRIPSDDSPGDELHLDCRGRDHVVHDCLAKLEFFCEYDAFKSYDLVAIRHASETDMLRPELLQAMNSAMRARSSKKAWERFLGVHLPELAQIPPDMDLIGCTDSEYLAARETLQGFYLLVTATKWITDMAASKMLYLKRPFLTAISDSYVREALMMNPAVPVNAEQYAARALATSDAVRQVGRSNIDTLCSLEAKLAPLMQRISDECGANAFMSKARMVDILIWADAAIGRNQVWTREANSRAWLSF